VSICHRPNLPVRHSLPVTTTACALADSEMLVPVTDPQGRITDCNPVIVRIGGDSAAELPGQPHNTMHHPDMPEEVFRDMRDTTQAGQPGSGLDAVRSVSALLGEISSGARHQEQNIGQVKQADAPIDGFTQQNAAMAEQLSASAQALDAVALHRQAAAAEG
jgi:PAS domain-containing protein